MSLKQQQRAFCVAQTNFSLGLHLHFPCMCMPFMQPDAHCTPTKHVMALLVGAHELTSQLWPPTPSLHRCSGGALLHCCLQVWAAASAAFPRSMTDESCLNLSTCCCRCLRRCRCCRSPTPRPMQSSRTRRSLRISRRSTSGASPPPRRTMSRSPPLAPMASTAPLSTSS